MSVFNQPWPYLATAALIASIGYYAWKQPHRPGAHYFGWLICVWLVWAFAAGITPFIRSIPLIYALWAVQSICALVVSPISVVFSLEYTGNEKWLARRSLVLLFVPALFFAVLAIIAPSSFLVTIQDHSGVVNIHPHDVVEWIGFAYNIAIWLINLLVLIDCYLHAPAFRAPIIWILLGQIVPRAAYAITDWHASNVSSIQAIFVYSSITAITYFIALYFFHILMISPVARDTALDHMPYGEILLDASNHLVDFNLAAQRLPGLPNDMAIHQPASRALGDWWAQLSSLIGPETYSKEITLQTDVGKNHFQVQSIPLLQPSGWRIGQVFVIEDITKVRRAEQHLARTMWAQATFQEREQLADELHDGLSQNLALLNLQAQTALLYMENGNEAASKDYLTRLAVATEQIQDDAREMIGNLLSVSPPVDNFSEALHQLLDNFQQQTGMAIQLKVNGNSNGEPGAHTTFDNIQLPPPVAVQLVRITQEALSNIRKHAPSSSQVTVQLKTNDGMAELIIEDDGEGFDPSTLSKGGQHFGLQVMRQRAERIGGQLSVFSKPGNGTCIKVCAPLAYD